MPHFITYGSYASEGAKGLISNPTDRAAALAPMIEAVGGKIVAVYFVTGDHDVVVITEAPSGTDAAVLSLVVGASGAMSRIETVMAWTSSEFIEVARKAGSLTGTYTPPGG